MAQFALIASAAIAAYGKLKQGEEGNASAKLEAAQMDDAANAEAATSQRTALEERRQARYARSRAIAVAAASGSGGDSVTRTIADIDAEGNYRALVAQYEGDDRAQQLRFGGKIRRKEGRAALSAGYVGAAGSILGGASSWYGKYGGMAGSGSGFGAAASGASANSALKDAGYG